MLSCTEISFVISFFNFEKYWVKPGLPFTKLNRANTQNLGKKINFDIFYKNACWAVIWYPICVTNVSYERKIIVLPFPVISFVILIFVFLIFEIKSGFPFYWLTLYTHPTWRRVIFSLFPKLKGSPRGPVLKTWKTSRTPWRRSCGGSRKNPSRSAWRRGREGWESALDSRGITSKATTHSL